RRLAQDARLRSVAIEEIRRRIRGLEPPPDISAIAGFLRRAPAPRLNSQDGANLSEHAVAAIGLGGYEQQGDGLLLSGLHRNDDLRHDLAPVGGLPCRPRRVLSDDAAVSVRENGFRAFRRPLESGYALGTFVFLDAFGERPVRENLPPWRSQPGGDLRKSAN